MSEKEVWYLGELYATMRYYNLRDGDKYHVQILTEGGLRLHGSFEATTAEEVVQQVKDSGIEVKGETYLDYFRPRSAIEKKMRDEILELRRIIHFSVGLSDLLMMEYDIETARQVLRECHDYYMEDNNA